jgi:hypothetical protein
VVPVRIILQPVIEIIKNWTMANLMCCAPRGADLAGRLKCLHYSAKAMRHKELLVKVWQRMKRDRRSTIPISTRAGSRELGVVYTLSLVTIPCDVELLLYMLSNLAVPKADSEIRTSVVRRKGTYLLSCRTFRTRLVGDG